MIKVIGVEYIYVIYGYIDIFKRWFIEQGYDVYEVQIEYIGELVEMNEEIFIVDNDKKEDL